MGFASTKSTTTIIDSQTITVPAGNYWETAFSIPSDKSCSLNGAIDGIAGANRDFIILVATDDQFAVFSRGASNVTTLFESGQTSRVKLSVPLRAGSYHLVVSNKFSSVTEKWVRLTHIVSRCDAAQ
jgi:hypothetical protein